MNIFTKLRNYFLGGVQQNAKTVSIPVGTGVNFFTQQGNRDVAYSSCIDILAKYISNTKFKLYDINSRELAMSKFNRVLNVTACEGINASCFWALMETNRLNYGNAYAYIKRTGNRVDELIPLDPSRMTVYYDNIGLFDNRKIIYEYIDSIAGKTYTFLPDELLHLKAYSLNGIVGRPAHSVLADTLGFAKLSDEAMAGTLDRGYSGTVILSYTSDLSEAKQKTLLSRIKEKLADNNTKILPLPVGMDAKTLSSNLEAHYKDCKELSVKQISAFFGIPLFMLNLVGGSGNASMTTAQATSFYNATVQPVLKQYLNELTCKLLSRNDVNQGHAFDTADIAGFSALSATERVDALVKLATNNVLTPNEARREIGFTDADAEANKLYSNSLTQLGWEMTQNVEKSGNRTGND